MIASFSMGVAQLISHKLETLPAGYYTEADEDEKMNDIRTLRNTIVTGVRHGDS
jgi:hypothetical protein